MCCNEQACKGSFGTICEAREAERDDGVGEQSETGETE
jgi:hypothetical protein